MRERLFGRDFASFAAVFVAWLGCTAAPAVFASASGGDSIQEAWLVAPDGSEGDYFGASVAVSGDTLVIGAPDATVGSHAGQGAAYVFVRGANAWSFAAKLTAFGGAFEFGYSVAIAGDTIVVGAPGATVGSNSDQGAVYVFVRPSTGWATTSAFDARLTASSGRSDDLFGISVAISGDTIVVGPRNQTSDSAVIQGAAYVFVKPPGGWVTTSAADARLTASDGTTSDGFGNSVSVSGDVVVAGASNAYIGSNASQGAVYVFVRPPAGWATTSVFDAKLTVSNGTTSTGLGDVVAISGDTIAAKAGGARAYVFHEPSTAWATTSAFDAELTVSEPGFGESGFSMAFSGEALVLGTVTVYGGTVTERGAAYVFSKPTTGWATSSAYDSRLVMCGGAAHEIFGLAVASSGDTVAVGAPFEMLAPSNGQDATFVFAGDFSAAPPSRSPCIGQVAPVSPAPVNGRDP